MVSLHLPDSVTGTKSVVGGAVVVRGASPGAYGDGDGGGGGAGDGDGGGGGGCGDGGGGDGCGDGGGGDGGGDGGGGDGGGGAGDGDGGGGDGDTRSLLQIGKPVETGARVSSGFSFQTILQYVSGEQNL